MKRKIEKGIILAGLTALLWVSSGCASCSRALVDMKSDLGGGLERVVRVYTANGDLIASYEGKIDLEQADGYVKFDFKGKRYIYYNCFIETIGEI